MAPSLDICAFIVFCIASCFAFDLKWNINNTIKMPVAASSQLICHLNDTVYFLGGRKLLNNTNATSSILTPTDEIYVYNLTNQTFEKSHTKLPSPAYFASNYLCDNHSIYMVGAGTANHSAAGQVWIFDTISHNITTLNFPSASSVDQVSLPCIAQNQAQDSIYIIGGKISDTKASSQLLQFNYSNASFVTKTSLASLPYDTYGAMCQFLNNTRMNTSSNSPHGSIYVFGGEAIKESTGISRISVYNATSNAWRELSTNISLTQSRSFTRAIYYERDNMIFIVGGGSQSNATFLNTTDVFYVSNYSVLPAFGQRLPFELEFNTVSRDGDKMLVWGGFARMPQNVSNNVTSNATQWTKENIDQVFVFDLPGDTSKNTTLTSIIIVSGTCAFMLLCGCSAYLLCGRNKPVADNNDVNSINYKPFK